MRPNDTVNIGILVFPGMLQLDATGPYGVLAAGPGASVRLIWKNNAPVISSDGLAVSPAASYADCGALDVVVVPGGLGVAALLADDATLHFLRGHAKTARYMASVCTGALVLGAAGLLQGRNATTHWQSLDMLRHFGAIPAKQRVVRDGNVLTAAGVTSGVDMALALAGLLWGDKAAQAIQLSMEYTPEPPYTSGTPETAPRDVLEAVTAQSATRQSERLDAVIRAAERLRS